MQKLSIKHKLSNPKYELRKQATKSSKTARKSQI